MRSLLSFFLSTFCILIYSSCSTSKQLSRQADTILLKDTAVSTGHIGISIYEPATNKYWYNHNAAHYFIPASNTKLFTLYAGMKYLGDSLVAAKYDIMEDSIFVMDVTADPSFLNKEFSYQPLYELMRKYAKVELYFEPNNATPKYGNGWAWNDYLEAYMTPPSQFPIYNNLAEIYLDNGNVKVFPELFINDFKTYGKLPKISFEAKRQFQSNTFWSFDGDKKRQSIPFIADITTVVKLLKDTLKNNVEWHALNLWDVHYKKLFSQKSDTLFKIMMHRSDNFFADQTLLMASKEKLGFMSEERIIDLLLKSDLKDLPQRPKWVDGSGLSRYNLFTPMSLVYLLNKMKNEFGWNRLTNILATGGEGTISNYYKKDSGFIYAKTGTLSNNCALSGFLVTNKGKLLIFSILANNYISGATPVRRAVERFLEGIRAKY